MYSFIRRLPVSMLFLTLLCTVVLGQVSGHGYDLVKPEKAIIPQVLKNKISISLHKTSYEEALNAIADTAGIQLNFNQSKIPLATVVSIDKKDIPVIEALIYLMKVTNTELLITEKAQLIIVPVPEIERKKSSISGSVKRNGNGSPIPLVNVTVIGYSRGASTDLDGNFKIPVLPFGIYSLEITCMGYETKIIEDIRLDSQLGKIVDIALKPSVYSLKEVTVTPGTFAFMESNTSTQKTMDREDIESVGQLGEDIYRAIKRLPGLSSGDYSAQFSVRGGNNDETLVLLDGLELYEPYHMKDFNEGALSILDVEAIDGVELMTGGFTAEYGNKTSGVLNFASRKPNGHNTYGLGFSLMNVRAMSEGSFSNNKGSWFFSARRGYMDIVFDIMGESEPPRPQYYDSFLKLRYDIHPNHSFSVNVLHAGDHTTMNEVEEDDYNLKLDTKYYNTYLWLTLNSIVSKKLVAENILSFGNVSKNRKGINSFSSDHSLVDYDVNDKRDFNVINFKQNWMYEYSQRMLFKTGFDIKSMYSDYRYKSIDNDMYFDPSLGQYFGYTESRYFNNTKNGLTAGLYLSDRIRVLNPLTCEFGIRYDYSDYTNDGDISPRVNAAYRLARQTFLRAGWGIYRQMQGLQDLNIQDGNSNFYPSEKSEHINAGIEHLFANGTQLRIEGYFKTTTNLSPADRNWNNDIDMFPEIESDRIIVYGEKIESRGMEVYLRHKFWSKLSLSGSYALAFVDEKVNRIEQNNMPVPTQFYDKKHPHPNDQRHTINLECTYKPAPRWSINLSYAYHSGWPYTTEVLVYHEDTSGNGNDYWALQPAKLFNDRLPAYSRLDLRITHRMKTKRGDLRLFAEVVNLTNHTNIYGYDYESHIDNQGIGHLETEANEWFGLLPSIGISWTGNL